MAAHSRQRLRKEGLRMWGFFLLLFASALSLDSGQQAQVLVVSVSGEWKQERQDDATSNAADDLNGPVRFGQTLNVGQTCLVGKVGSIVLKFSKGEVLYAFPCELANQNEASTCPRRPPNSCAVDLRTLGNNKPIRVAWNDFWKQVSRVLTKQPDKYMIAGSRGGEPELVDAVVPMEDGRIDLKAIFRDLSPGKYYVEFSPPDSASFQGPPSTVTYSIGAAAFVPARGLRTGLYRVLLVDQKGEPGDSDCWILLEAAPDYTGKAAAFEQAVKESAKLPQEMDPGATRALLRAYLESLSQAKETARP